MSRLPRWVISSAKLEPFNQRDRGVAPTVRSAAPSSGPANRPPGRAGASGDGADGNPFPMRNSCHREPGCFPWLPASRRRRRRSGGMPQPLRASVPRFREPMGGAPGRCATKPGPFCRSQARTAARYCASSGVSWKFVPYPAQPAVQRGSRILHKAAHAPL